MTTSGCRIAVAFLGVLLAPPVASQVTQRGSVSSSGSPGNGSSSFASISADGRYVAFSSVASNLVPGDTNGFQDVFVRDRQTGVTDRVSIATDGTQGNLHSTNYALDGLISADGRHVVFYSGASNLVPGDTNNWGDAFLRDRQNGTTEIVSRATDGTLGNNSSVPQMISPDGRFVLFQSRSTNLVPGDTNGAEDLFLRDRQLGTTERVNLAIDGSQANASAWGGSISADGRFVAFMSAADNLVFDDTNGTDDVFLRDRQFGVTQRASVATGGEEGNGASETPRITGNGRFVLFKSFATNLIPGDTNGVEDLFARDRLTGTTERVNVEAGGPPADYEPVLTYTASPDGRYIAFISNASTLVPGDTNNDRDTFVHDRQAVTTVRVSVSSSGEEGNDTSSNGTISDDGRFVAFWSEASNLVPGDTNATNDIFVRDLVGGTAFNSLCEPGVAGVISCPCSNPPSGPGPGCDNSSATGGAFLSASGGTYLSSDTLVFTTVGEKPTATSIVLQGNAALSAGTVYGQGVRCAGGSLKRLFVKSAVGGSITAPDFDGGDPSVSARSAAKGDTILAGQSRWYLVYYRDPVVLGGCSASSTFNATQTGRASWAP